VADYLALKNEILLDPLGLGYSGKTDAQVAALMNGASRPTTTPRTIVAAHDVYEAIDPGRGPRSAPPSGPAARAGPTCSP
jgi:hypothetical protein